MVFDIQEIFSRIKKATRQSPWIKVTEKSHIFYLRDTLLNLMYLITLNLNNKPIMNKFKSLFGEWKKHKTFLQLFIFLLSLTLTVSFILSLTFLLYSLPGRLLALPESMKALNNFNPEMEVRKVAEQWLVALVYWSVLSPLCT